jgi:hypothetical protein
LITSNPDLGKRLKRPGKVYFSLNGRKYGGAMNMETGRKSG